MLPIRLFCGIIQPWKTLTLLPPPPVRSPLKMLSFEAQFGSESDLQDWQDWRAACLEADMGEPFLDDAH